MKRYIGTKIVLAEPMTADAAIIAGYKTGGHFNDSQGYEVEYEDKYRSWSPKLAFDNAYRLADGCSFGLALEAMKAGKGARLPAWQKDVVIRAQFPDENSKMTAPYLYVESRFGKVPWKETMIELFSNDWEIV